VTPETALETELLTAVSDVARLVTPDVLAETDVETLPSEVDTPPKLVDTLPKLVETLT
jgi:hypothetical protein